ncbi:MAG TPA: hypothetical protein IAB71_08795 [Candidatus Scatomonas pullistercoris]|uniref:Uroporphyrinogen decarboxylase (URO-D) domain-containing protein n=1 Tax=Candidatus Scatomonas pullistercoris TaxID=2840920 RepID=A0A9D1P3X0_9FIRM|nr:hypothetical protein [Candidatus Scatomonas pullistercoris]
MPDYQKLYEERKNRVETAVHGGQPDRVPNVLLVGTYPIHKAGITMAESMVDHEKACQAMLSFYETHSSTDTASISNFMPAARVLENLDVKTARWPGDPKGLDVNNTYQFIEFPTLEAEEYEEFFRDPAGFWISKHLPRTMGIFEPLADLNYYEMILGGAQAMLTSPQAIPVYKRLLAAAEENLRMNEIIGKYDQKLKELGYYSIMGGGSATAFDMLGDTLRGTFGMMPDLIEERDNVKRALDIFVKLHLKQSLDFCRATGSKYAWVMLHKGFDNFISDTDYRELYWPYLQEWILGLIDHDITPVVYTEGSYNTRLKYLKEVPAHKVIYHFEEVDLKLAKKELGDVACLMGGFPVYTVRYGNPQQIDEQVKELMDIMAPGGGYLFTTGYSLEDCPEENMEALLAAVEKYGKY